MTSIQTKLLGVAIALAAMLVVIKRKLQPIQTTALLPAPPEQPAEPSRIVLPSHIISTSKSTDTDSIAIALDDEEETQEPVNSESSSGPATQTPDTATDNTLPKQAYCMACRKKQNVLNGHKEILDNGRPALRGTCEVCGANVFRFLPKTPKE